MLYLLLLTKPRARVPINIFTIFFSFFSPKKLELGSFISETFVDQQPLQTEKKSGSYWGRCFWWGTPGNANWKGRFNTIDLLVLTRSDQLTFMMKLYFSLFTKRVILMRRSSVLSLPPQLGFPGETIPHLWYHRRCGVINPKFKSPNDTGRNRQQWPGCVFTTLLFLLNLPIDPIS
jgi:hypothetical protein